MRAMLNIVFFPPLWCKNIHVQLRGCILPAAFSQQKVDLWLDLLPPQDASK